MESFRSRGSDPCASRISVWTTVVRLLRSPFLEENSCHYPTNDSADYVGDNLDGADYQIVRPLACFHFLRRRRHVSGVLQGLKCERTHDGFVHHRMFAPQADLAKIGGT